MNRSLDVWGSNRSRMSQMITCVIFLAAAILFASCSRTNFTSTGAGGWTQDNNQHAALSDYRGKVIVLDFYATWCEPCRAETPRLVALQKQYGEKGLQVVGLNVGGEDDRDKIPQFAKDFGIQYPLAFPDDELVQRLLSDNQNIPQAFVFDRQGELVKRFIGYNETSGAELDRIVQGVLANGPVARQQR